MTEIKRFSEESNRKNSPGIQELLGEKWQEFNKGKRRVDWIDQKDVAKAAELTPSQVGTVTKKSRGKEGHGDKFFRVLAVWEGIKRNFSLDLIMEYFQRSIYFYRKPEIELTDSMLQEILNNLSPEEIERLVELSKEEVRLLIHIKQGIILNLNEREKVIQELGKDNLGSIVKDIAASFMSSRKAQMQQEQMVK